MVISIIDLFYSYDYKWLFEDAVYDLTAYNNYVELTVKFSDKRYFRYKLGTQQYVDTAELNLEEYEYIIDLIESLTTLTNEKIRQCIIYEH